MQETLLEKITELKMLLIMQQDNKMIYLIALVLIGDIIFGIRTKLKLKEFLRDASKATATILNVEKKSSGRSTCYEYEISFPDYSGTEQKSKIRSSNFYKQNDKIEVLYVRNDFENVKLNQWAALNIEHIIYLYFVPLPIIFATIHMLYLGVLPRF